MYLLNTFGGLGLETDGPPLHSAAVQRRRLGLLVLLARSPERGMSREKLLALLWPESSEEGARHALDQLLYATRRDLGRDAVLGEAGQLRLNPTVVRTDCAEFEARVDAGEFEPAVAMYTGPFLDSVYLGDHVELERWVEAERRDLAEKYFDALERLARGADARGDLESAAAWWRRRAAADPLSARVTLRLMESLAAAGDRAGAIRHARTYALLLRDELGVEPDAQVAALADRLASGFEPPRPTVPVEAPAPKPVPADALLVVATPPPGGEVLRSEQGSRPAGETVRGRRVWRWAAIGALSGALLVVGSVSNRSERASAANPPGLRSVAVLPFDDLTRDRSAEYLGDGMSEELIHALAQIPDIRVVARTSAFTFKDGHMDVREIARALGVEAVLEGSVRQEGNRLRVTAQLIDAATGYHLWSGSFDRRMGDALSIQHQIAGSIVRTLRPQLAGGAPAVSQMVPRTAHAYHLFLRGRYAWHRRTEAALHEAIGLFEEAIRADPSYAEAYAGLADAYDALADAGFAPQDSSYRVAQAAAERAIQLDTTLADAYAARGHIRFHRWDWDAAEQDFARALELNPGYSVTYAYYALPLVMRGRFDEGLEMIRKAQELDPLALNTHAQVGWLLTLARRYGDAADQLRTLIAMDSTRDGAHARLGLALVQKGEHDAGIASLERAVELRGEFLRSSIPLLGYAYARAGRREDAERILRQVERGLAQGAFNPYYAAALAAALGDRDRAFELLDRTFETSRGCLIDLGVDPLMDTLRSDGRYANLARALGMQPWIAEADSVDLPAYPG